MTQPNFTRDQVIKNARDDAAQDATLASITNTGAVKAPSGYVWTATANGAGYAAAGGGGNTIQVKEAVAVIGGDAYFMVKGDVTTSVYGVWVTDLTRPTAVGLFNGTYHSDSDVTSYQVKGTDTPITADMAFILYDKAVAIGDTLDAEDAILTILPYLQAATAPTTINDILWDATGTYKLIDGTATASQGNGLQISATTANTTIKTASASGKLTLNVGNGTHGLVDFSPVRIQLNHSTQLELNTPLIRFDYGANNVFLVGDAKALAYRAADAVVIANDQDIPNKLYVDTAVRTGTAILNQAALAGYKLTKASDGTNVWTDDLNQATNSSLPFPYSNGTVSGNITIGLDLSQPAITVYDDGSHAIIVVTNDGVTKTAAGTAMTTVPITLTAANTYNEIITVNMDLGSGSYDKTFSMHISGVKDAAGNWYVVRELN